MRDVLEAVMERWSVDEPLALATVVATFQSAPRPPSASMFVTVAGEAVGSVSGGCVEGAVYDIAQDVLASGAPELHRFGVSDGEAFAVGLTCGGILDVFVERVDRRSFAHLGSVAEAVRTGLRVAVATIIDHPENRLVGTKIISGGIGDHDSLTGQDPMDAGLRAAVRRDMEGLLDHGESRVVAYGVDGAALSQDVRVFIESFAPRARLLIFGAIDFAASMATVGSFLGFHVTVCDARQVFATNARFPQVDEVVVDWPHRYLAQEIAERRIDSRSVICVLTHDPKFDVPLLEVALRAPYLSYVGAMGSRRTHSRRMASLREAGLTEAELDRLVSPIGLDLGAISTQETAISIAAEIIASQRGGTREPLRLMEGPIHRSTG